MPDSRRLLCAWSVASVTSLFMVACATSPEPQPEPGTSQPGTSQPAGEHGSYAHCLSEHGIDEPPPPALGPQAGPGTPPAGVDPATWEQALQSCASLAPGPPGP